MTIAQLAAEMGYTRQTIYAKLKTNGITPDALMNAGDLTPEGQQTIRQLFLTKQRSESPVILTDKEQLSILTEKLTASEKTIAALQTACNVQNAMIEQLRGECAFLRSLIKQQQPKLSQPVKKKDKKKKKHKKK